MPSESMPSAAQRSCGLNRFRCRLSEPARLSLKFMRPASIRSTAKFVKPTQKMPFEDVSELRKGEKEEIERFFLSALAATEKKLRYLGWRGAKAAEAEIKRGQARLRAGACRTRR